MGKADPLMDTVVRCSQTFDRVADMIEPFHCEAVTSITATGNQLEASFEAAEVIVEADDLEPELLEPAEANVIPAKAKTEVDVLRFSDEPDNTLYLRACYDDNEDILSWGDDESLSDDPLSSPPRKPTSAEHPEERVGVETINLQSDVAFRPESALATLPEFVDDHPSEFDTQTAGVGMSATAVSFDLDEYSAMLDNAKLEAFSFSVDGERSAFTFRYGMSDAAPQDKSMVDNQVLATAETLQPTLFPAACYRDVAVSAEPNLLTDDRFPLMSGSAHVEVNSVLDERTPAGYRFSNENLWDMRREYDRKAQDSVDDSDVELKLDESPSISCDGDQDLASDDGESPPKKIKHLSRTRERVSAEHPQAQLIAEVSLQDFTVPEENAVLTDIIKLEDDGKDASLSFDEISEGLTNYALPALPMLTDAFGDTSGAEEMAGYQHILEHIEIAPAADSTCPCTNDAGFLTKAYPDCEVEHNVVDRAGNQRSTELMNGGEVAATMDVLDQFRESNPYDILALEACALEDGVESVDVVVDISGNESEVDELANLKEGKADEQVGVDTGNVQNDVEAYSEIALAALHESAENDLSESDTQTTGFNIDLDLDGNSVKSDIAEIEASRFLMDAGMSDPAFSYEVSVTALQDKSMVDNQVLTNAKTLPPTLIPAACYRDVAVSAEPHPLTDVRNPLMSGGEHVKPNSVLDERTPAGYRLSDDVDMLRDLRSEFDGKAQEGVDHSDVVLKSNDGSLLISCDGTEDLVVVVGEIPLEKTTPLPTTRGRVRAEHPDAHLIAKVSLQDFAVPGENAALADAIKLEDDGPPDASMSFDKMPEGLTDHALPALPTLGDTFGYTSGAKEMDGYQDLLEVVEIAPSANSTSARLHNAGFLTKAYPDCQSENNVGDRPGNQLSTGPMNGGEVAATMDVLDQFRESNSYDILALEACAAEKGVESADVVVDTDGNEPEVDELANFEEGDAEELVGVDASNVQNDVEADSKLALETLPESVEDTLSEADTQITDFNIDLDLDGNSVISEIAEVEVSAFSIDAGMSDLAFSYEVSVAALQDKSMVDNQVLTNAETLPPIFIPAACYRDVAVAAEPNPLTDVRNPLMSGGAHLDLNRLASVFQKCMLILMESVLDERTTAEYRFPDDANKPFDIQMECDRKAQEGVDYTYDVMNFKDGSPPISCDSDEDLAFGVGESPPETTEHLSTTRERVSAEHSDAQPIAISSLQDYSIPGENAALPDVIELEDDGPPDALMSFDAIAEGSTDRALPALPILTDAFGDTSGAKEMDGYQHKLEHIEMAPSADSTSPFTNDAGSLTKNADCEVEHNVVERAENQFSTEPMNGGEVASTKDLSSESNRYDILALEACAMESGVDSADVVVVDTGGTESEADVLANFKEGKDDEQVGVVVALPESAENDLSQSVTQTTAVGMSTTAVNNDLNENSVMFDIAELDASSFLIHSGILPSAFSDGMSDAARQDNGVQTSSMASFTMTPAFNCSTISPDRADEYPKEAGDVLSGLTGDLTDAGVRVVISDGGSSTLVKRGDNCWRDCDVGSIQGANVGNHSIVEGIRDEDKQRMGFDVTGLCEKANAGEGDINDKSSKAGASASGTNVAASLEVDAQALMSAEKLQRSLIAIGGEQNLDVNAELRLLLLDWKLALIHSDSEVEDERVLDDWTSALDRKIGSAAANVENNSREIAKLKPMIADFEESRERLQMQGDDLAAKDAELAFVVNRILEGGSRVGADMHRAAKFTTYSLGATLQRFASIRARGAATNVVLILVGVAMVGIIVYVLFVQWMEDRRLYGVWLGLDDEDTELRRPFSVYVEMLLHYFRGSSDNMAPM
ncbi:hypothetical protein HK101_002360 [Irineochytrium annulatum]|nr:hypothetical protein HK101_002360 [Irineochytrium annulatum]